MQIPHTLIRKHLSTFILHQTSLLLHIWKVIGAGLSIWTRSFSAVEAIQVCVCVCVCVCAQAFLLGGLGAAYFGIF